MHCTASHDGHEVKWWTSKEGLLRDPKRAREFRITGVQSPLTLSESSRQERRGRMRRRRRFKSVSVRLLLTETADPGLRASTCGDKWHESGTMCPSHGDRDAQNAWHESHAFDCAHLTVDQDPRPSLRLCLHLLHNLEEILKVLASVVAVCLHTPCTP